MRCSRSNCESGAAFTIAHAHTLRGEFDRALEWLSAVQDEGHQALLFQLAVVHINRDEPAQALEVLLRGFEPDGARLDAEGFLDAEGAVMFSAFIAYQLMALGRLEEARPYVTRAFEAAGRLPGLMSPQSEAHMAVGDVEREDGNLAAAAQHYDAAIEIAERLGNVLATCSARNRRSYLRQAQGNLVDAVDDSTHALALADRIGFSLFQAWSPTARAGAYLALGRLDEAAADFEAARHIQERLGSSAVSVPLGGLGDVHRARGELTQARSAYERALAAAERSGRVRDRVAALTGLAYVLVDEDEREATRVVTAAVDLAYGSFLGRALVASGWVALRRDDRDGAHAGAEEALANARRRGEPELIAEALELRALCGPDPDRARLEEANAIWKRIDAQVGIARTELALAWLAHAAPEAELAEGKLRRLGVRQIGVGAGLLRELAPSTAASSGDPHARPLRSAPRGTTDRRLRVAVEEGARSAEDPRCAPRARGRRVTSSMELLWPDEDPGRLEPALRRAQRRSRRPRPRPRARAGPLPRRATAMRSGSSSTTCPSTSRSSSATATEAMTTLPRRSDERAAAPRARRGIVRRRLPRGGPVRGLGGAAREMRLGGRTSTSSTHWPSIEATARAPSARIHLRALALDPYDEEIHLAFVSMLIGGGRHGEARRAYRRYVDRMREIDVEPAQFPETGLALSQP